MTDVVTVARVAEVAGVSVPTVSKVLNRRKGVSELTRAAVEDAIERTGYVRRQRGGRAGVGIVDLLVDAADSQWPSTIIQGVAKAAQHSGLDVVVTPRMDDADAQDAWFDRLRTRGTDGVIAIMSEVSRLDLPALEEQPVPVVLVDPIGTRVSALPTISATNWAGGLAATEHLLGLGHRRIGIITGPEQELRSMDRLDGYSAALRRAGVEFDPVLIRHGDSLVAAGKAHGGALLDLREPPTAIFACSDEQACGVYEAALERGLQVPKHLSVVGFDDDDLCQWVTPRLTTVRQPLTQMGREAVRWVTNPMADSGRLEMATSLIIRDSTAAPYRSALEWIYEQ